MLWWMRADPAEREAHIEGDGYLPLESGLQLQDELPDIGLVFEADAKLLEQSSGLRAGRLVVGVGTELLVEMVGHARLIRLTGWW